MLIKKKKSYNLKENLVTEEKFYLNSNVYKKHLEKKPQSHRGPPED